MKQIDKQLFKEYKIFLNAELPIDKNMIKESINNYINEKVDYTNKTCLDLGSNLGTFSKIAIDHGAKEVFAVECDHRNFNKANNSFKEVENVTVIHAAVSGSTEKKLKIFKSNANSNHSSTSILKRGHTFNEYDEVDNVNFTELVNRIKPDIIKIDIEGAEYQILDAVIEYSPVVLFIEIHGSLEKCTPALAKLRDHYRNYIIDEIIFFNKIGGHDCLFYK